MPLTDEERRQLDALAAELSKHDPRLTQLLSGRRLFRLPRRFGALALIASGVIALLCGIMFVQIAAFSIGSILLTAGVACYVIVQTESFVAHRRPRRRFRAR